MPSLLTASDVPGTGWFGAVAVDVQPGKQSSRSRGSVIKRGRPPDEPRPILIQSPGQEIRQREDHDRHLSDPSNRVVITHAAVIDAEPKLWRSQGAESTTTTSPTRV